MKGISPSAAAAKAIAMLEKLLGARYKVIKVLASGGFGQTYVAEDMQRPGHPQCVVKHFKPANQDPSFLTVARRLFYTEAETLEKLGRHDQIPRLLAYFEEDQEFYLVQEFIEGRLLSEELSRGKKLSEEAVIELLQDVLGILTYVHAQGAIHRDIKPSNLIRRATDGKLVLIDFGAVKFIHTQMVGSTQDQLELTVGIGTQGYMPVEQLAGKPRFNSDIYALGTIAIRALTGLSPSQLKQDPDTSEIIWQDQAQVSDKLAAIINKMVRYHYGDRYQSATEVLQALQTISDPSSITEPSPTYLFRYLRPTRKRLMNAGAIALAAFIVVMVAKTVLPPSYLPQWDNLLPSEPDENAAGRISFGNKILAPGAYNAAKQEGADLMATGVYSQAVIALEAARKRNRSDPETLIYLNNARIGQQKAYAIAAPVPLGSAPGSALEMLRGVAQAQDEVNAAGGINGVPLKVAIADDKNRPETARAIAKVLVKNPEILGVIGHGISDTTIAAGAIYQSGQLVAISPLSSAVQLSGFSNYIFRTMPSDLFAARALSNYMVTRLKKQNVAIFFSSTSKYSQSLSNEFKKALFYSNAGKIVAEVDLSRPDFDAYESVEQAIAKGAEAILLAANSDISDRGLQVIQMNRQRLKLLAGDGLYSTKTLQIGRQEAVGMVLAVPAAIVGNRESKFQTAANQLWGGGVTWRTALSYDATKALIAAIRNRADRKGVQRSLAAPDFSLVGATGKVSFLPSGDREAAVQLVTVTPVTPGKPENGYKFQPLQ